MKEITVSIIEPIKSGYNKDEFLNILEKSIYDELNRIG